MSEHDDDRAEPRSEEGGAEPRAGEGRSEPRAGEGRSEPRAGEGAPSLWARGDERPADAAAGDGAAEAPNPPGDRRDPMLRPPDPAGTKPLVDPAAVVPPRAKAVASSVALPGAATSAGATGSAGASAAASPGASATASPSEATPAAATASEHARYDEPPHAPKFQFALGALIAVGFAAVAAVIVIAIGLNSTDDGTSRLSTWSAWHPVAAAGDGPTQIAEHVGREYRLPEGGQLVAVTGGAMEIAGLPLTVALREPPSQGGDIELISGKGVLFRMCGLGPKCAIDEGKPSTQRHLLLRREALELSLYAFHYLDGVEQAVVFLPPKKGEEPSQALYFRKSDLAGPLLRPLNATLVPRTPSVGSVAASPDASLVNTITTRTLFQFSFTQANQDARAFLVLEPLETH